MINGTSETKSPADLRCSTHSHPPMSVCQACIHCGHACPIGVGRIHKLIDQMSIEELQHEISGTLRHAKEGDRVDKTRLALLRLQVRNLLWKKMCEHDQVDPTSQFVVFSDDNPFSAAYNDAMSVMDNPFSTRSK